MTLKNYLKYSGLWFGFVLNPYHWNLKLEFKTDNLIDDYVFFFNCYLGPVWLKIIIDDGKW
jgi:hypothetical protein